MEMCSDGHNEIVFMGRPKDCPLCEALQEIENLKDEIAAANP